MLDDFLGLIIVAGVHISHNSSETTAVGMLVWCAIDHIWNFLMP